jgi:hypothetical protein
LIDTLTVAFASAADDPPADDKVTHDCVFPAVQLIEAPPGFESV